MSETEIKKDSESQPDAISEEKKQLLRSRMIASQFGNMVTIMMQSPHHRNIKLGDLYRRLVPPLLNNQFRLAETRRKESGATLPIGLILWARVSDEVHDRMIQQLDKTFDLDPKEWRSGNNYWIIDAIGPDRFVAPLLSDLRQREFKGQTVHYRAKSLDGPEVRTLKVPSGDIDDAQTSPAGDAAKGAPDEDKAPKGTVDKDDQHRERQSQNTLNGQHATS